MVQTGELDGIGLSATGIEVYEALIDHDAATAEELAAIVSLGSEALGEALADLEAKGLARRLARSDGAYSAVPPEVGAESLLRAREAELRRARKAIEEWSTRFRQARVNRPPNKLIEVIVGQGEVTQQDAAIYRSAQKEVKIMTRPPYHQTEEENRNLSAELHQRPIAVRNLVDPDYYLEDRRVDDIRVDIAHGEQYRVMSRVPMKLMIADEERAIIELENPPQGIQSAVLIHPSALLRALSDLFETLWSSAVPLDILGAQEPLNPPITSPTQGERELIGLLAAGVPDTVIERQLGMSHRTVQRHVQELKERLGARSRFQAGVQAALRGWITDAGPPDGGQSSS